MPVGSKYSSASYRQRRYHKRKGWTLAQMDYIWKRDSSMCIYCGSPGYEIDHVVPVSKGGPSITENGVLSCRYCNHRKAAKLSLNLLTRAFYHLLMKGENIGWLDDLWLSQQTQRQW